MCKSLRAPYYFIIFLSLTGLVFVYLFQRQIQASYHILNLSDYQVFIAGRTTRFILNDLFMILLIYGIFQKKKYVIFAFYVQLAGIFFVLVPYLTIKYYTSYNGPLISFLHRLVINPLLMLLLIPAFFYQEKFSPNQVVE